jgi:hypothetical protein
LHAHHHVFLTLKAAFMLVILYAMLFGLDEAAYVLLLVLIVA